MFLNAMEIIALRDEGAIHFPDTLTHKDGVPCIPVVFTGSLVRDHLYTPPMPTPMYGGPTPQDPYNTTYVPSRGLADTGAFVSTYHDSIFLESGEMVVAGTSLRITGELRGAKMLFEPSGLSCINQALISGPLSDMQQFPSFGPVVCFSVLNASRTARLRLDIGSVLGHVFLSR